MEEGGRAHAGRSMRRVPAVSHETGTNVARRVSPAAVPMIAR
jgi:hypothetical protein